MTCLFWEPVEMENEELFRELMDSYDDAEYPPGFPEKYCIMECLSEGFGIITFLVRDKEGNDFIAKCYDRSLWAITDNSSLLNGLDHEGLPKQTASFINDTIFIAVREYIEGMPLSLYVEEKDLSMKEIIKIATELCDILAYLHHRDKPIIHRDIKPQNIIIRPDGGISLIDFDIARVYRSDRDTDTVFFGTPAYAPPEQYGFSQTDARTDIYSLGIVLRFLLTGSTKENPNIRIYRPLSKIIRKCTAFAPEERFADVSQVKSALLMANPKSQSIRMAVVILCAVLGAGALTFGGIRLYRHLTYSPFTEDAVPAFLSDAERVSDAVSYLKEKYETSMFDETEAIATVGDLRTAMIDLYGLDRAYVYGINEDMPQENDAYFLPWGWADSQTLDRDVAIYAAVKVHDPAIVADWSSLKDDNGFYPGARVATAFAKETGIMNGANHPGDIPVGELAVILANADRVFEAADTAEK